MRLLSEIHHGQFERFGGTHVVWRKEFLLHYGKFAVFTTEKKKVELELELET
jgi:hypothetical protein